jgi:hypothetical protein
MTQQNVNKVSIRLMSGGHSFSRGDIDAVAAAQHVDVTLCTQKTTLVPKAMLRSDAGSHLAAVGLAPKADECVVVSECVDGVVAVMALARGCYDYLCEHVEGFVCFHSPLLVDDAPQEGSVLSLYGDTLYVAVYRSGLRFAEAMPVAGDADILYYVESLHRLYDIYNMHARAKGDARRLMGLCKPMFRSIVCE